MQFSSSNSSSSTTPIAFLNDQKLHEQTLLAANHEKSATLKLLEHLAEVDKRRLYATMSYSSLWLYVHHELGYSESQTSERIQAMRLMVRLPEVKNEIENNRLSLTSAAKLATHARRERMTQGQTLHLLQSIQGKPTREVERVLASHASEPIKKEMIKPLSAETTRIMMDVDQEFLELLQRVRELKGHPGSSTSELIQSAMKELVKRADVKKTGVKPTAIKHTEPGPTDHQIADKMNKSSNTPLRAPEVASESMTAQYSKLKASTDSQHTSTKSQHIQTNNRYIPTGTRYAIRIRSGDQCEYIDPTTGRRCDCRTQLEFDHIIPFAMGGDHSLENLRHFCRAHNQLAAVQYFGMGHMRAFLKN